ncbi:MAG TPA: hypothetical protein VEI02_01310, partial [Planctomycetota bacterium]|nr:hypothetical protein [Planctomycetota bacterium]
MRALLALSAIALTAACSGLEQPLETSPPRASATTLEPTARSAPPPAAPPAAPRAEPEVEPGRARRTTRDFVVDYPAALAADADAVVAATTAAIRALEAWSEVSFADVLDGGALTVRVAVPEERRVGPGGVEVRSAFRGAALAAAVDVLAPSAYPAGVGTLLGEPLDERHLRRRLTHGAGALFARRLRRIAGGW